MEIGAFDLLKNAEDSWWYRARAKLVHRMYEAFLKKNKNNHILDIGAGWGGMFDTLSSFGRVSAYEPYTPAAEKCRTKNYDELSLSLDRFEKRGEIFDAAGAFDVLEHIEDEVNIIRRIHTVLKPGGLFVATIPAFMFLWSKHDVTHMHFRRYSRKRAVTLFESNGYEVVYASYWNFILFPLALVMRIFGFTGESSLRRGGLKDRVLGFIAEGEVSTQPPLRAPWGTGLVVVARKKERH